MRTLLVDDSDLVLKGLQRYFAAFDLVEVVGVAHDGREALQRVTELAPELVLMDVEMPGMNGLVATRNIKAMPSPPRVLILSLHASDVYRQAAEAAGADGICDKTDIEHGLLPAIERIRDELG